jgi:hypothetical protein
MRTERLASTGLWALAIVLRVHNALGFPLDGTADARLGHLRYIGFIREHWQQPPTQLNWETWQPPLFYWMSAGLWALVSPWSARPDEIFAPPQAALLPLVTSAFGLAAAWVAVRVVRRLVPADPLAALVALAVVLFWPMHLMLAPWLRPDLIVVLLVSLVVARLSAEPDLGAVPARAAAGLGVLAGLALLSKYTGTAALVTLGACLGAGVLVRRTAPAPALRALGVGIGTALVVAGWFYARNWLVYGKPFATPADWFGGFAHPPASRSLADYVWFAPVVFVRPWVSDPGVIHSLWAGTYATAWFDGQYIFVDHYMSRDTAVWAGRLLLLIGLPLTLAILAGAARALWTTVRARRLEPHFPLLVLAAWSVAGYVFLNVEAPYYSTVKAHYLMTALVPAAVFLADAVACAPRRLRALLAADAGALVLVASVVFWFGMLH